jgi:hypothetical protein
MSSFPTAPLRWLDLVFGVLIVVGIAGVFFTAVPNVPPVYTTLPSKNGPSAFSLDTLSVASGPTVVVAGHPAPEVTAPLGADVRITGWAVDVGAAKPASSVLIVVDGRVAGRAAPGERRLDVATALHLPTAETSGFSGVVPAKVLPLGRHTVSFRVVDAAGGGYFPVRGQVMVSVVAAGSGTVRP